MNTARRPLLWTTILLCGLALGCRTAEDGSSLSTQEAIAAPTIDPMTLPPEERRARDRLPGDPGFFSPPHESPNGKSSDRFPNTVLTAHDGTRYRFYEDLVRDRIVIIQFLYTRCNGI